MGISVSDAYARARELRLQAQYLQDAKSNMATYKSLFGISWQGDEITYYQQAISSVETRLIQAASLLDSLACSIEATANQIRQEEIEEERRRYLEWLEEQERIQQQETENLAGDNK